MKNAAPKKRLDALFIIETRQPIGAMPYIAAKIMWHGEKSFETSTFELSLEDTQSLIDVLLEAHRTGLEFARKQGGDGD
jgi:hypothetical protein